MDEQAPDRGAIIGWALARSTRRRADDDFIAPPGTRVGLVFPKAGNRPEAAYDDFTVVGYFKSGMSEYDSSHVYVPLDRLQYMRLGDGKGRGAVNAIQIKVKPGVDIDALARRSRRRWRASGRWASGSRPGSRSRGPLLAAVAIEQSILNMLLFFIIAVAGFGILAIFFMIVVEKTRDIGILKALGRLDGGRPGDLPRLRPAAGAGRQRRRDGRRAAVRRATSTRSRSSSARCSATRCSTTRSTTSARSPRWSSPGRSPGSSSAPCSSPSAASVWPAQRAAKLHPVKALRFE